MVNSEARILLTSTLQACIFFQENNPAKGVVAFAGELGTTS